MSRRVTHRRHPQRGTILGGGTAHVRMRPRGGLREQRERDAQFGAAAYLRPDLPPKLLASDAFTTTTPSALGRICGEPFEGEIGSDKTNGVTSATARQHH